MNQCWEQRLKGLTPLQSKLSKHIYINTYMHIHIYVPVLETKTQRTNPIKK